MVIRSIEIKKEAENVIFLFLKKTYERREIHCSSGFCRISKVIEMKGVVILVKVDEMYNIFKVCYSLLSATVI